MTTEPNRPLTDAEWDTEHLDLRLYFDRMDEVLAERRQLIAELREVVVQLRHDDAIAYRQHLRVVK
ncbi:MAG: hypothetical protein AAGA42_11200 [Actinomycetota bacterium]